MTDQETGDAVPDSPEALAEDIQRTREELGETVQALVAKTDVKTRAQQSAAEVSGHLKERARGFKDQLSSRTGELNGEAMGKAAQAREAAWNSAPEPVRRNAQRAAQVIRQRPVPVLAIAGAALIAGWLVFRRRH